MRVRRNVFEDLDTFICILELTFIPSKKTKCVVFGMWQVSPHRRLLIFGITVECITETWGALYHSFELTASTAGVSVVCRFVVLVILKFIKAQGRILKIKLKDL